MGYEQKDIAYLLGLKSHSCVSEWEQGKKNPSIENLLLLSILYRTLPDQLYYDLRFELQKEVRHRLQNFEVCKARDG